MEKIIIYTDGGSRGNPGPAAVGVYIETLGKKIGECIGTRTNNAVIAFQNKMRISPDGKVGPMTWNKLNRLSLVNTANQIGAGDNGVQTSYDSSTYKGGELGSGERTWTTRGGQCLSRF